MLISPACLVLGVSFLTLPSTLLAFVYPTPDSPLNPPYQYSSKVIWCPIDLVGNFSWHKVLTKVAPCLSRPNGCPWLMMEPL